MGDQDDIMQSMMLNNMENRGGTDYEPPESDNNAGGLSQASAATEDGDMQGVKGAPLVSRGQMDKADQHLQSVIDNIIKQQQRMQATRNPDAGPSRAAMAAIWGGQGGGSFGAGMANGMRQAAPLLQRQEDAYNQAQEKMNALRIQAAQVEQSNQAKRINAQVRGNLYNQRRADEAVSQGFKIDENGNKVFDPAAMQGLANKASMLERARLRAQGLTTGNTDLTGTGGGTSAPVVRPAMPHSQAIMMAESGGNPDAPPGDGGKAIGPMQLHKDAADEVGVKDRNDPAQNIAGGKAYLDKYTKVYTDQGKENPALWATVAYKDGPGYASKWDGDIHSLSAGTQAYIDKVNGYMKHGLLNDEPLPGLDDKIAASGADPSVAPRIKAMIEGRAKPLAGFGSNSPYGRDLTALINKVDPTYDEHRYTTIQDFDTGATSKIIRPINTSIAHLDTLQMYGEALKNGDVNAINKAKNEVESQLGQTAPSTFAAIKPIVANEVVKAIVARGGGEADRAEAQKALSEAKSPEQLNEVIKAEKSLLAGQMSSMRQTYVAGTNGLQNFDQKYLTSPTRHALAPKSTVAPAAPKVEQHDTLPDPAQYKGKIATDSTTGAKLISDGKSWNPQ